jgi:hypothetical protein
MKIFLSWSGDLSRQLAEALRDWLPAVIQSVKPFFTPNDIEKGARWSKDIAQELEASSYGIFCLTKENLTKPWIMFEAGALSKKIDVSRVCPVLFGVDNADLEGPLVQFQASPFNESEMRKLIKTLNAGLGDQRLTDSVLTSVFDMWWPKLQETVSGILESHAAKPEASTSIRSDRDILEEVLELARLNSSTKLKNSRSERHGRDDPNHLDPAAMAYSLKHIMQLCKDVIEQGQEGEYFPSIREIFSPLKYMSDRADLPRERDRELEEIIMRIDDILYANRREGTG